MPIKRTVGTKVTANLLKLLDKLEIKSGQRAFNPAGIYGVAGKNIESYVKRLYTSLGWNVGQSQAQEKKDDKGTATQVGDQPNVPADQAGDKVP